MQNILLINFKRIGDIISSINAVEFKENCQFHFLCFEEFRPIEKSVSSKVQFHFIDRKKIEFLVKSPLSNDGFAVSQLSQAIKPLLSICWDEIINFSNDQLAARLIPILKGDSTKVRGIYYQDNKLKHPSSLELYLNNIIPQFKENAINLKDLFCHMNASSPFAHKDFLAKDTEHDQTVKNNFQLIKERYSQYGNNVSLVGIAPFASSESKSINEKLTKDFIQTLKSKTPALIPIVIHAPTKREREIIESLSQSFGDSLITIEADLLALNSVLGELDYLVAADSAIIHYANALGCNSLMVSKGESPLFLQGTSLPGDLVLTSGTSKGNISADELHRSLTLLALPNQETLIDDFKSKLYLVCSDGVGAKYMQLTNNIDYDLSEVKRDLMRQYLVRSLFSSQSKLEVRPEIVAAQETKAFIEQEKNHVLEITKNVLTCLRLVRVKSQSSNTQFLTTLQQIIDQSENRNSLTSIPLTFFYHEIQETQFSNPTENTNYFEKKLFELKNNLQIQFSLLKDFENFLQRIKTIQSKELLRGIEAMI